MNFEQVYQIVNDVAAQHFGQNAIAVTDTSSLYSLGSAVFAGGADAFLSTLIDRVARVAIRTLDYTSSFPGLLRNEYEFGNGIEKINVQPFIAKKSEAVNVGDASWQNTTWDIDKPQISVYFFKDSATWEIDCTMPDTLYRSAFTSAAEMERFISAIYDMISTTMSMQLDQVARAAVVGMMAEKVDAGYTVVDLLTAYNSGHTPTLTAAEAMESPAFLKYAGKIMRDYISYLQEPSTLYNSAGLVRATSRDNMHVFINTQMISAYNTYLEADTFHKELISLPYFNEIKFWQGTGTSTPNLDDCTDIKVNTKNGDAVEMPYVVACFADREAIGVGMFDRWSAADRLNRQRLTNITSGAVIQHFIDLSENIVIFTLGQPTITP